jgi:hypothetical protein
MSTPPLKPARRRAVKDVRAHRARNTASASLTAQASRSASCAGCCGFAGDRGTVHEELTETATTHEAAEVLGRELRVHEGRQPIGAGLISKVPKVLTYDHKSYVSIKQ